MRRYGMIVVLGLAMMTAVARAQIRAPDQGWIPPSMPVFNAPASSNPPPPTTQHSVDANGNAVDTTTTYRTGPFGTYVDHTTTTTYPAGNPSLGTSSTH
jgi:hypothetical protein